MLLVWILEMGALMAASVASAADRSLQAQLNVVHSKLDNALVGLSLRLSDALMLDDSKVARSALKRHLAGLQDRLMIRLEEDFSLATIDPSRNLHEWTIQSKDYPRILQGIWRRSILSELETWAVGPLFKWLQSIEHHLWKGKGGHTRSLANLKGRIRM
jgi:hypothetical protein